MDTLFHNFRINLKLNAKKLPVLLKFYFKNKTQYIY